MYQPGKYFMMPLSVENRISLKDAEGEGEDDPLKDTMSFHLDLKQPSSA